MLEISNIESFYGVSQALFGINLKVEAGEVDELSIGRIADGDGSEQVARAASAEFREICIQPQGVFVGRVNAAHQIGDVEAGGKEVVSRWFVGRGVVPVATVERDGF